LDEIDPAVSLLILDENFATQDPGEAAEKLLTSVGSRLAASG
jgi:energy-coupling factor transporter ATP-binding protein EcfA2